MRLLVTLLLFPFAALACEGERLVVDADNSTVSFTVTQGDAPFSGSFSSFGGTLCRESGRLASMNLWLDPESVDAGLPEVNELLLGPEFFRVDEHPRVTFESTSVERNGFLISAKGQLTINGISKVRSVEFRLGEADGSTWQARGRFTLRRLDHDLGRGEWKNTDYLDDEVIVEFNATLLPEPGAGE